MSEEFSFCTYAEYVYHVPLIFAKDHGIIMPTESGQQRSTIENDS